MNWINGETTKNRKKDDKDTKCVAMWKIYSIFMCWCSFTANTCPVYYFICFNVKPLLSLQQYQQCTITCIKTKHKARPISNSPPNAAGKACSAWMEGTSALQYPTIHCVLQHCVVMCFGTSCKQEMSPGLVIFPRYLHSSGNQSQANI